MHPLPSRALTGLLWIPDPQADGEVFWHAEWEGRRCATADVLAQDLRGQGASPAVRFEAWLAFGLGLDGFAPIIDVDEWRDILDRGPVDAHTGAPDGAPIAPEACTPPHDGVHGLEGLIIHPATGHVLRALTEGLDGMGAIGLHGLDRIPLLIPMTPPAAQKVGA